MQNNVLLVDDDVAVLQAIKRSLRKEKYTILTATSGAEALDILQGMKISVIVTDERMPGLSGTALLGIVAHHSPDTVRIMLTGQATLKSAIAAINEGEIYRFFTKPCNEFDLAFAIREALKQRELVTQTRKLVDVLKMQASYINSLESENPGITTLKRSPDGGIIIDECHNVDDVLDEVNKELEAAEKRLSMSRKSTDA